MQYRRFGKTGKKLSVITLGGMRFKHGSKEPRHEIPKETLEQAVNAVRMAFNSGINHIETAWGYKRSETIYGRVLNEELHVPRESYHLMTKGNPMTGAETRKMVEKQLHDLQTDYLDFYGWHGINNDELLKKATTKNGPVEELHKLKEEGVIKHVGFSTHAPVQTIIRAIETGMFEFVNLHYYYFNQRTEAAVSIAQTNNLGVFIISPNDKGGQLFKAPEKVKKATTPLTPIQWNARFCLQNPAIHTLSFGITEPEHFTEMEGIFPFTVPWSEAEHRIKLKLDSFLLDDAYAGYDGIDLEGDASGVNIAEVLRLRRLWKCYDMKDYAKYRYKIFENKGHWFPGVYAFEQNLSQIDYSKVPESIPLKKLLQETHNELFVPDFHLAKK